MRRSVFVAAFVSTALSMWLGCASKPQPALKLAGKPGLIAGFGTAPVTDAIASMWFASGPMPKSGVRPAIMVYYLGPDGWLDKETKPRTDASSDPVFADFQVGDIRLYLRYWPTRNVVNLFGQEVSVETNNVIVATFGTKGSRPVVQAVSSFRDVVPDGANPGEYVLRQSPDVQNALHLQ